MALKELILRPSADVSGEHSKNSGKKRFSLINEATADNDSTYIFQPLSGFSEANMTSSYKLSGKLPTKINVTKVTVNICAKVIGISAVVGKFSANATINGTKISTIVQRANSGWQLYSLDLPCINEINAQIQAGNLAPFDLTIATSGASNDPKNGKSEIRITQVYVVVQYEEVSVPARTIFIKQQGEWNSYQELYIKENNQWVKKGLKWFENFQPNSLTNIKQ